MILIIISLRLFKSDEICHVCIQLANFRDIGLNPAFGDGALRHFKLKALKSELFL
jgi:hypothetical protein